MYRFNGLSLLAVALFFPGCVNAPSVPAANAMVTVETVYAGSVCSGAPRAPKATWIDSHEALNRHWQQMLSHHVGDGKPLLPQIEWKTHGIVLIHMGQKNSGGYRLELAQPRGRLESKSVLVSINWIEPPAGAIATQMITSPCLMLKIQRGPFSNVMIVDQTGHQRARADLPE